jgi:hypothetical protein
MKAETFSEGTHCLHADVSTVDLAERFEGIWPIPGGISQRLYHKGRKTAFVEG